MTAPQMSDSFAKAFRQALVTHVDAPTYDRRRHRRWVLGRVIAAFTLLASTATAAATGVLVLPGGTQVTPVSSFVTGTYAGTETVHLGPAPDDANGIVVSLHCLTPGYLGLPGGTVVSCAADDLTGSDAQPDFVYDVIPLTDASDGALIVTAPPESNWTVLAAYSTSTGSEWATNGNGESYGAISETGPPDLIAVRSADGATGYIRRSDLERAVVTVVANSATGATDGITGAPADAASGSSLPLYDSDGTTQIGEFTHD
ncbi:hypothetical protein [Agreia sp. Leaf283]|uniref:hypothetical protein n=1 Tax=Agreia sp. Leaf283 TaxID=1736321 RepID=UPI0006F96430|nr:hypothetical protein [Agreia sp. Leaf283]KQP55619.1 hypothetical protein ASF51_10565 [Agreia sp. Leaf283]